jgi:lysophospholipase L1-like esterase
MEILLRVVGLGYPLLWEPDPELGWKHVPGTRRHHTDEGDGHVVINSLGQRDRPRTLERSPGSLRIAVFGDSLTEALQVDLEQTFCSILEEKLSSPGRKVEVLNFGVSGYSPVQELISLKRNGPLYRPDVAVLALFLDNDVSGCLPALNPTQGSPPYVSFQGGETRFDNSRPRESYESFHRQPIYFLRKTSAIFRALSEWRLRQRTQLFSREGGSSTEVPKRFLLYSDDPGAQWAEAWGTFEQVVLEFVREAQKQGIKPLVLSVPAGHVACERGWKNILAAEPALSSRKWNLEGPEDRLRDFLERAGVPLVQPLKSFQAASRTETLFFGNIGHLTPQGHRLLAGEMETFLRKHEEFLEPAAL